MSETKMSIADAKIKLAEMEKKFIELKEATDPAAKEYRNYLSVQIATFDNAIQKFEGQSNDHKDN